MVAREVKNGVRFEVMDQFAQVAYGFSTRSKLVGNAPFYENNMSFLVGDNSELVQQNRNHFLTQIGTSNFELVVPTQTHSVNIAIIDNAYLVLPNEQKQSYLDHCDATITNLPSVFLSILTADCIPILLFDSATNAIAAIHSGWKGSLQNIVGATVEKMVSFYNSNPSDIYAMVGPSISADVYEIGEDVKTLFSDQYPFWKSFISPKNSEKWLLNLPFLIEKQLLNVGLPNHNILQSNVCTFKNDADYFSHRRDGLPTGRMMSGIGIRG